MATADEYAAWIVKNADKRGTPEFDTVAAAYKDARQTTAPSEPAPDTGHLSSEEQALQRAGRRARMAGIGEQGPGVVGNNEGFSAPGPEGGLEQQLKGITQGAPFSAIGAVTSLPVLNQVLPSGETMMNAVYGEAENPAVASGRGAGMIIGMPLPTAAAAQVARLQQVAKAAELGKTATALGAAKNVIDPLTPLIGGAVNYGLKGVNALRNAANYVLAPGAAAENRLTAMTSDQLAAFNAMQNTQNMPTSGYTAPVSQRLAAGNVAEPAVAGAEAALAEGATGQQVTNAQQARIAAIQSNLQNVEQQLSQRTNALTPAQTAQLSSVRNSLRQALAAETAGLEAAGGQITGQIPNVGQQAPGQTLANVAAAGRRDVGTAVTSPAYRAAYELAGNEPITVDAALDAARRIQASPGAITDTSTVPQSISRLQEFQPPMQPGPFTELAPGQGFSGPPARPPATVTLEQFGDIRESLVRDLNAARKSPALDAPTRANHLQEVLNQMDAALAASGVSEEARAAYQGARQLYRTAVVEPYKTGETARLLQTGSANRPALLPDDTVNAFLKNETSAQQYATTFGNNPAAARAMGEGVGDLFRREVVDTSTGLVDPTKASAFIAKHARQLDTLETAGVNVRQQLTQIADAATQNATQRATLAEASRKLGGIGDAKALVDEALKSPVDMDFMRRRLTPAARDALGAEVKNRALDMLKANDPEGAIKYLTDNAKTIQTALGRTGPAEHAAMLNTAKMQQQLVKTVDTLPNTGLFDPVVLRAKFAPSKLADLRTAVDEIRQVKQAAEVSKAGAGSRIAPAPMEWGDFIHSVNPWVWLKTIGAKAGKNALDARVTAEAYKVMYENPERFTKALDRAITESKRGAAVRGAVSNNLTVIRPGAAAVSNALANQQEAP
jgi:hypothetical protein